MTIHDQRQRPPRRNAVSSDTETETGDVGFAALPERWGAGTINVEVTDQAGARRVLMVRFPRAKAIHGVVTMVLILGLPFLLMGYDLDTFLFVALFFGWYLVLLLITAVRGAFLALTQTGVLIQTGLGSVLVPWTAISGASADTIWLYKHKYRSYPGLRLSIRGDYRVPGWPWPAALSPVLLGSSRRKLHIVAWWFEPVPLDRMVMMVRYFASHPEERQRIGSADPDEWLQTRPTAGQGDV